MLAGSSRQLSILTVIFLPYITALLLRLEELLFSRFEVIVTVNAIVSFNIVLVQCIVGRPTILLRVSHPNIVKYMVSDTSSVTGVSMI